MLRCYVTDRRRANVETCARRAIARGIEMIQVREKDLKARDLLPLVRRIVEMARNTPTEVLVNDRLDVALAAEAHGVHLPANGLPIDAVRPLVRTVGVSTHTLKEALEAQQNGADFIAFGPVFETPGKRSVGVDRLKEVATAVSIPVLAIGGIDEERVPLVMEAGAAGYAAIRLFQDGM